MDIYKKFAEVYDTMGADQFSKQMFKYCMKIFKRHNIKPQSGLDLCCGTGSALLKFTESGIEMSGLDQSKTMLDVARKKVKGHNVKLYQRELPKFSLLNKKGQRIAYDVVTSFYDSLNYMNSEAKLKAAFKSVYRHLNKDGWFVFDMNTPESLKTLWDEQTNAGIKDDMAWIWTNEYDKKKKQAACYATFFKKKGKLYERFEETHYERAYSNRTIKRLLKESGFKIEGFYNCLTFEKPDRDSTRICVVAKKEK